MKLKHFVLLTTMTLGMAISSAANAGNNILAIEGHDVWSYANESCMRQTWLNGGVKNQCSSTQLWVVPLPFPYLTYGGNYTVTVTGTKTGTTTQCIAIATDQYGNNVGQSSWVNLGTGSGWATVGLSLYVPAYAGLQVQCNIPTQAVVQNVSF
jgi:hypothetical protein